MNTIQSAATAAPQSPRELVITRTFDAPREVVFRAWIDPRHLAQWWGPKYFTNPVCEIDARPGGSLLIHMAGPDGAVYPMRGVFNELVEPERLVFTAVAIEDDEGNVHLETRTSVTFEEQGGKTKLTMHALVTRATPAAEGAIAGMEEGWNQSLDSLAEFLARK